MTDEARDHHRRSLRLQGYKYSRVGAYFVTICTQAHRCLFGEIEDGNMRLNDAGSMIQTVMDEIPSHYPDINIDEFVIMPNHVHGIVIMIDAGSRACHSTDAAPCVSENWKPEEGQPRGVAPTDGMSLPDVVHRFKTMTTKRYIDGVKLLGWQPFAGKLWQRNYWEHVVRNENELAKIREYIRNNPIRWESDGSYMPLYL